MVACLFASATGAGAATYSIDLDTPSLDKWQYPFGGAGGTRTNASTFGAVGSAGFDDRDAQFYIGFDTGSIVPKGLGSTSYTILSAKFTLSMGVTSNGVAPSVVFDGTYDPIATFGPNGEPINGDDPGRPMELYGVGYRGGFTNTTVEEGSDFGAGIEGGRNLYSTDFAGGTSLAGPVRDVSNNVTEGFNPSPFSIGQVAPSDLTGGIINEDADIVFTLNLANSDVLRYLQLSLNDGRVAFLTSSLLAAAQTGPVSYPVYYTKENLLFGLPGRLEIEVLTAPEPGTAVILAVGAVLLGCRRNRRDHNQKEALA